MTQRIYTNSEDGLYGPAIDNDFATNKWVYLFYSPQTVTDVKLSDGSVVTQTTPTTTPPNAAPSKTAWDPYVGYFQLSRFKFVEDASGSRLDLGSEQQILRVPVNRQECCHVGGDIDFDTHNNLWLVTGDDNPAGGINGGGFGPSNDQLTDEQQTVRVDRRDRRHVHLDASTARRPRRWPSTPRRPMSTPRWRRSRTSPRTRSRPAAARPNGERQRVLPARQAAGQPGAGERRRRRADRRHGRRPRPPRRAAGTSARPVTPAARALNTNDLRGKLLRFTVKAGDIAAADANKADFGQGGAYTIPAGNMLPLVAGAPQAKTRPEVYAMGFRNPFRVQVDSNDVAYMTDYSPDSRVPQRSRGPAGTGRYEIVRKPSNYGWPTCYSSKLGYYKWNFHEWAPGSADPAPPNRTVGVPLNDPPEPHDCGGANPVNDSRWNLEGGPSVEPGLRELPPVTDPDIWYSYNDNNWRRTRSARRASATTPRRPARSRPAPPPSARGCSRSSCTAASARTAPTKYEYDPDNPNPKKFPPYYDDSVIIGEFGQDMVREIKLDGDNHVFKISNVPGLRHVPAARGRVRVRQPDGPAVR